MLEVTTTTSFSTGIQDQDFLFCFLNYDFFFLIIIGFVLGFFVVFFN